MIRIRSSSLSELLDCPARWKARHLDRMDQPSSARAQLGTAIHAGTAAFDQAQLSGSPISADEAAAAVVDAIHRPDAPVDWDDLSPREAERIALPLHTRYCREISPQFKWESVELPVEPVQFDDLGIVLTGTVDRVFRDSGGNLGVADLKSGLRSVADGHVDSAKHKPQIGCYELLVESHLREPVTATAQIVALKTGKTMKGQDLATGDCPGAKALVVGAPGRAGLLEIAAHIIQQDLWFGNPRSQLCSQKFCPAYRSCRWR